MTDIKHTLGPWERDDGYIKSINTGDVICTPYFSYYERTDEQKANAHLIAAAPEMYEALKNLVESCQLFGKDVDEARAALAKAEGK